MAIREEAKEDEEVSSFVVRVEEPAPLATKANAWVAAQVRDFEERAAASGQESSLAMRANLCASSEDIVCLALGSTSSVGEDSSLSTQVYFIDPGGGRPASAENLFTHDGSAKVLSLVESAASQETGPTVARLQGSYFDADGSLIVPVDDGAGRSAAAYRIAGTGIGGLLTDRGKKIRRTIMDTDLTFPGSPSPIGRPDSSGQADASGRPDSSERSDISGQPGASASAPAGDVDCTQSACVALTFDDGPSPYTEQLLDTLRDNDARATFFVTGPQVEAHPGHARRAFEEGHAIGNHSWSHPVMTKLSRERIASELTLTNEALARIAIPAPHLMRPPYGEKNPKVMETLASHSMAAVLWNVDTEDWKNRNADATVHRALDGAQPGAIILMHDSHPSTAVAAPIIIDELHRRGYELVTVPELVGGNPEDYAGRSIYSQYVIK